MMYTMTDSGALICEIFIFLEEILHGNFDQWKSHVEKNNLNARENPFAFSGRKIQFKPVCHTMWSEISTSWNTQWKLKYLSENW